MIKVIIVFMLVSCANGLMAKTWLEIFNDHEQLLVDECYHIIKKQLAAYAQQAAPTIVNSMIKNIPIIENDEQLIDVREMQHPRITMLPDAPQKSGFVAPEYNSGLPSASKMRKALWYKFVVMVKTLDELAPYFGYKSGTIAIKVFEGLRDIDTQRMLFENKAQEIKAQNPQLSDDEVEQETSKWVSPVKNNVPVHSTGAAVDIRLWHDEANTFIDLGKFGVIWGPNPHAPTFSEDITDVQKLNRLLLLMAAARADLVNYCYEYWHFSHGDRYATFWQESDINKRYAYYGSIKIIS